MRFLLGVKKSFLTTSLLLLSQIATLSLANKEKINEKNYEVCAGMYSKDDWGGKIDPFISFNVKKFQKDIADTDGLLSVAIYDFQDYLHLGANLADGSKQYVCDDYAVSAELCSEDDLGNFIIETEAYDPYTKENKTLINPIMTFSQDFVGLHDTKYPVTKTGFYCVTVFTSSYDVKFDAVVNFRNAYGHLAGSEVNKLPLYGLLAVGYVIAMALYFFAFWKHKHELLPLQKYLLAFYVFLTAETIFVWAYYDIKNEKGNVAGTKVYMIFLSLLTAGKLVFSFFILLVISLGYGIVYPKLNKTLMRRCQFYAIFSFLICSVFLVQSYLEDAENPSPFILITFIPLVLCMLGFYLMILRSMTQTVRYLKEQRQVVKLNMYKKLLIIIYTSLIVLMIGFIITIVIFSSMNTIAMIEKNWRSRFFFTDFWPTLVYFVVFVIISFLWRPTDTSYMLAVSQQLPTDPENVADFDLSDLQSLGDQFNDSDLEHHDDQSIITNEEHTYNSNPHSDNNAANPQEEALDFSDHVNEHETVNHTK